MSLGDEGGMKYINSLSLMDLKWGFENTNKMLGKNLPLCISFLEVS